MVLWNITVECRGMARKLYFGEGLARKDDLGKYFKIQRVGASLEGSGDSDLFYKAHKEFQKVI